MTRYDIFVFLITQLKVFSTRLDFKGELHQSGYNPNEIPLRFLLLQLLEIYHVYCMKPHFHVRTDGLNCH